MVALKTTGFVKLIGKIESETPYSYDPNNGLHEIDASVSIAISLKRIADNLDNLIDNTYDQPAIRTRKGD